MKLFILLPVMLLWSCQSTSSVVNKTDKGAVEMKQAFTQVYISDGSAQCQNLGRSLEDSKQILLAKDIAVKNGQCAELTGVYFMSVCGGANGKIHVFDVTDVERAQTLGFKPVAALRKGQGIQTRSCP